MIGRRTFLALTGAALGAAAHPSPARGQRGSRKLRDEGSFDPWVEILAEAIRNNVREIYRFCGRRLMAVAKNNANGIGLREIGPILDDMDEVFGIAVVRADEALALRAAGVRKPILMMAHVSEAEAEALVARHVRLSPFHDGAARQLVRLARRFRQPVRIHLYIDTGMNRVGMPYRRALPWIEELAASRSVAIEGAYTMFSGAKRPDRARSSEEGEDDFDRVHLRRFLDLVAAARDRGIELGLLHGAPSYQITSLPASHQLDLVRPGGAIYGMPRYRTDPAGRLVMDLKPVFRLRARVVRVERIDKSEGVSFGHRYVAERPAWIATLPVGHTDGYPRDAAGRARVLIGENLYPVIGVVSSNHTIVEIGEEKSVEVGAVATLVGPDRPEIAPQAVAEASGLDRDYWIMTKLNALLPRKVI